MQSEKQTGCLISLEQARDRIRSLVPSAQERVSLAKSLYRVVAEDLYAVSDCPSVDSSLKDGFAVQSADISLASEKCPVQLISVGTVTAGQESTGHVKSGQTIRIMTGAALPFGADAVLASEFSIQKGQIVSAVRDAHPGRNVLVRGSDVAAGDTLVKKGTRLLPTHLGLLAAGGIADVPVYRQPRVIVIATGSELVSPGEAIGAGQVAASNLVTLLAELVTVGITADHLIVRDNLDQLQENVGPLLDNYDVVLTCGGVLDGDKDFTMQAMEELGVEPVFHRVRVGPGKGICLGKKDNTFIFNLPGGPPSNHVAYLLLARPGILRLCGLFDPCADQLSARLTASLHGQQGWTQIFYGCLGADENGRTATPITSSSRLQTMAAADCLIEIPEECSGVSTGTQQRIWKIR